jgi:type IV pilus assembly protein PilC
MLGIGKSPTIDWIVRDMLWSMGAGRGRDEVVTRMLARAVAENRDVSTLCEAFSRDSLHWREPALGVMAARIAEGVPLERAVKESPRALAPETRWAVGLGAATDTLPETLDLAAHVLSKRFSTPQMDRQNEAHYLAVVFFAMANVVAFICYYIIPKFKKIFDDFAVELPGPTVVLVNAADLVVNYFYLLVIAVGVLLYLWFRERMRFWSPGAFSFLTSFSARAARAAPNLLRLLAIAAERSIPWPAYLDLLLEQPLPRWMRGSLTKVHKGVMEGHSPWHGLAKAGWLSAWEVNALEQSERVGNTVWTLRELANTRELRGDYRRTVAEEIWRPLGMLLAAIVVGFVVVALFLPIVKLINDLS